MGRHPECNESRRNDDTHETELSGTTGNNKKIKQHQNKQKPKKHNIWHQNVNCVDMAGLHRKSHRYLSYTRDNSVHGTRAWTNACRKRSLKIGPPAPAPAWPRPESHQRGGKVCSKSLRVDATQPLHTVSRPLIIPQPQPPVSSPPPLPPPLSSLPRHSRNCHRNACYLLISYSGLARLI